jgi:hypothetical protein
VLASNNHNTLADKAHKAPLSVTLRVIFSFSRKENFVQNVHKSMWKVIKRHHGLITKPE